MHRASVVTSSRSHYATLESTNMAADAPPIDVPTTLLDAIQQLPSSASWAVQHLQHTDHGSYIASSIQNNTAVAVSDGSLKEGLGTAGLVLEGPTSSHRIRAVNKVPGPIKEGDSHRCELSGIYGILLIARTICELFDINSGCITIVCDNIQALRLFEHTYKPDAKDCNFDMVNACWHLLQKSPIQWKPKHVKGHQDDSQNYHRLPRLAKLNVEMDALAKAHWHQLAIASLDTPVPKPLEHHIFEEGWQLWSGYNKIASPSTDILYSLIQDPISQMWWVRHGHSTYEAQQLTDHTATADHMKSLPRSRRIYVTKSASENCGVGTTKLLWKMQSHSNCPRCPCTIENTVHVQRCSGHGADIMFSTSIEGFSKYMETQKTHPGIRHALIYCMQQWRLKKRIDPFLCHPSVRHAIRDQHKIGWKGLFEGLAAKSWQLIQMQYFRKHRFRRSGRKWLRGILLHLHHMGWNQWEHRNKINTTVTKPEEAEAEALLQQEIITQITSRMHELSTQDHRRHNRNLIHLLNKPQSYRKSWMVNTNSSRQRFLRIQQQDNDLIVQSKAASRLYQWMQGKPLGPSI